MTTIALPPPDLLEDGVSRRFSSKKLAALLQRLGRSRAWLADGAKVSENTVRNWTDVKNPKQPDLDSYLDLVDFLRSEGHDESEILDEIK